LLRQQGLSARAAREIPLIVLHPIDTALYRFVLAR
jgi:hypothetical protein